MCVSQILLRAFLANVSSPSAVMRRTSAKCIVCVCENVRQPTPFFSWSFYSVIGLSVSVDNGFFLVVFDSLGMLVPIVAERDAVSILGPLLALRQMLPHLCSSVDNGSTYCLSLNSLLQVGVYILVI